MTTTIDDVLLRLERVHKTGTGQWSACCPAHGDRHPSLSVGLGEGGKLLLNCHAGKGCDFAAIMGALGLDAPTVQRGNNRLSLSNATAVYDYTDAKGTVLYKVARYAAPKDFRPWQPDGRGGWEMKLGRSTPRVAYRLPELAAAPKSEPVLWPEGEKDVDRALAAGFIATTTQGGAKGLGGSADAMRKALAGRRVAIIPDADDPGDAYAADALAVIKGVAASVAVVKLPGLEHKASHGDDLSDWLDTHGHTADELRALLVEALPVGETTSTQDTREPANCEISEETTEGDSSPNSQFASSPRKPPEGMRAEAYYGLAGDIVRAIDPHTEADPDAVLIQVLTIFGAIAGRRTCFKVSADRHYPNLYVVLVGDTAQGRKGMAWGVARHVFTMIPGMGDWLHEHTVGGMSSGEGLIHPVRDYRANDDDEGGKRKAPPEPLQIDKRMIVYEGEFSSVLKMPARDGNNLSEVQRRAWDGVVLQTLTKNSPERATGAHISIVGNITREELMRYLSQTETANGFGNRYLWVHTERSKSLPDGGDLDAANLQPLANRLAEAVRFVHEGLAEYHVMTRDPEARDLWHAEYDRLSAGYPALFGAMTARAVPQVTRLATIYALLDCSPVIRLAHLKAALAIWEYIEGTVRYVFGDALGDPIADAILRKLRATSEGMTRTDISELFARHTKAADLDRALTLLQDRQLARSEKEPAEGGGRPAERWHSTMVTSGANVRTAKKAKKGTPPPSEGVISHNSQFAASHLSADAHERPPADVAGDEWDGDVEVPDADTTAA